MSNIFDFDSRKAQLSENLLKSYANVEETIQDPQIAEELEKGGKRAYIGEKREFGGRTYVKTMAGWKFFGKGTGSKAQKHHAGSAEEGAKVVEEKGKDLKTLDTAKSNDWFTYKGKNYIARDLSEDGSFIFARDTETGKTVKISKPKVKESSQLKIGDDVYELHLGGVSEFAYEGKKGSYYGKVGESLEDFQERIKNQLTREAKVDETTSTTSFKAGDKVKLSQKGAKLISLSPFEGKDLSIEKIVDTGLISEPQQAKITDGEGNSIIVSMNDLEKVSESIESKPVLKKSFGEKSLPSNIKEYLKGSGSHIKAEATKVNGWLHSLVGRNFSGGTAIGRSYGSLVLDISHHGSEVHINEDGSITVLGEKVSNKQQFKAALEKKYTIKS